MNPLQMSLSEMAEGVRQQKLSSRDLVEFYRGRIQKFDKEINSFISLNEEAGAEASRIDEAVKSGRSNGRLLGVPIGIKDLLCTKGLATTAGSKILSNFIRFLMITDSLDFKKIIAGYFGFYLSVSSLEGIVG